MITAHTSVPMIVTCNRQIIKIRKQSKFLLVLFAFISLTAFSQSKVVIRIHNLESRTIIPYAKVTTSDIIEFTSENGRYSWNTLQNQSIVISAWNFADTLLFANDFAGKDSIIVYLRPQPEQLNEVLVNPKNSWLQNKIYGFERWQTPKTWGWAFLIDKELFVANQKLDLLYKTALPEVGGKRPTLLYQDILGNNYLLGKDSVQQIYITDTAMYGYPQRAENVFNAQLKPLLAQAEDGLIYRETKEVDYDVNYQLRQTGTYFEFKIKHPPLHNCGVLVKFKNRDTTLILIESLDEGKFKDAQNLFNRAIQQWVAYEAYMDKNMVMAPEDMDIKEKADSAMHLYKMQGAQYRQTYFLPCKNNYILFDPYGKQLITFNKDLKAIKKEAFDFTDCPREEYLYTDQATGQWWLQRRKRGLDVLESVRPGDPPQQLTLDPFVRNIRVHNNVVFYINQYGELRIKKINP